MSKFATFSSLHHIRPAYVAVAKCISCTLSDKLRGLLAMVAPAIAPRLVRLKMYTKQSTTYMAAIADTQKPQLLTCVHTWHVGKVTSLHNGGV